VVALGPHATLNAEQRRCVAKWARDMSRDLRERIVGAFVVLGSPVQRGVLSAVRWFLPELKDVYALDALDSAVKRALAALEARGVIIHGRPDEILCYIEELSSQAPVTSRES
jgi:nucleotide-binding universal stress UspA family protein